MDPVLSHHTSQERQSAAVPELPNDQSHQPPHPSQRSGGCSTFIEEREVSWSPQHPSRTGPSRWKGCNHRSTEFDRRMANPMDPVLSHHTSQEKQPAAVPELPNDQPHQSPKQSHAEDHTEQIESHKRRRTSPKNRQASEQEGVPQSRSSTYAFSVRNISSTSKTSTMSS